MRRLISGIGVLILFLFGCGSNLMTAQFAQKEMSLSGTIVDEADAPIANAHVWIHEQSDNATFVVKPNVKGLFEIRLSTGYYYVTIGSAGFAPFCKRIRVWNGEPIKINVHLRPDMENSIAD